MYCKIILIIVIKEQKIQLMGQSLRWFLHFMLS